MLLTKYTYSISNDTLNGIISTNKLHSEIIDSNISIALNYINTSGDNCDIWFKDELSSGDKILLDGIVSGHDGEQIDITEPKTDDGKTYVSPNMFPLDSVTNFCGVGDNIETGIIGEGNTIGIFSSSLGYSTQEFQFAEQSYLAGGQVFFKNGEFGDHVSFLVYASATQGTQAQESSFAKYSVASGVNIYIPYQNGGWNLDLTETLNSNVGFSKVTPVPAQSNGYFDIDSNGEFLTVNQNGTGEYNLFDIDIPLNEFVTKLPLIGEGNISLTVPAVKPMKMLPHWRYKITLYNSSNKNLSMAAFLYRAR